MAPLAVFSDDVATSATEMMADCAVPIVSSVVADLRHRAADLLQRGTDLLHRVADDHQCAAERLAVAGRQVGLEVSGG